MKFNPENASALDIVRIFYRVLIPRPIAWVSTKSKNGIDNLAPFSFYGGVCANPPIVSLGIGRRKDNQKDTAKNLIETGECVIHLATESRSETIVKSSLEIDADTSEFDVCELERKEADIVNAKIVAEMPVAMECKMYKHLEVGKGPVDFILVEIIKFHIDDTYLDSRGYPDAEKLNPLSRLGGREYSSMGNIWTINRPE